MTITNTDSVTKDERATFDVDAWVQGAQFALRAIAQHDLCFLTDAMKLVAVKLATEACAEEKTRLVALRDALTDEPSEGALSADEAEEFARTIEDFEDNGETSTDYDTLMDWACRGLIECVHFNVTKAGTDALTAAAPSSAGEAK